MPQRPHDPTGCDQPTHEKNEAIEAVAELVACAFALGDAEYGRSENGEQQRGIEVRESEHQDFFPIAMW